MRNVSTEFKELMAKRRDFYLQANVTFKDGKQITLNKGDFTISDNSFVDASDANVFPLGIAIAKTIHLSIMNDKDQFSMYDFYGAIFQVDLKFDLSKTTETIKLGRYTVIAPETYGTVIFLDAIDDMHKLDIPYETGLSYPAQLGALVRDSCQRCNVPLKDTNFKNYNFVIQNKPEGITHRTFIACAAQIACGNARIDENGYLYIKTYDFSPFEKEDRLDGGVFDSANPYATGDNVDGGSFNPWDIGYVADGGNFTNMKDVHMLYNFKNLNVGTDDVVITGISTTVDEVVYSSGVDGYVLSIENPLLLGIEQVGVNLIGASIIGIRFRPFTADHISYPLVEFGDLAVILDRKMNSYRTVITDINFSFWGYTTLKCGADSPIRNSSTYLTEATKAIVEARKNIETKITQYDQAQSQLGQLMSNSMGLFETREVLEDGSVVAYMHDKPSLSDSLTIWKRTIDAFAVSTDGGKTWNAGVDAKGNVLASVLTAIGINADWLNVGGSADGVISVKNASGEEFIRIGKEGIQMSNGARLMGGNGVLSHIQVDSVDDRGAGSFRFCGYYQSTLDDGAAKKNAYLWVNVPDDFTITEASITLHHAPLGYSMNVPEKLSGIGYARNLKLYKANDLENYKWMAWYGGEYEMLDNVMYAEIKNAFGANGFTGNAEKLVMIKSTDITANLETGLNLLKIETDAKQPTTRKEAADSYGVAKAVINITGYMS